MTHPQGSVSMFLPVLLRLHPVLSSLSLTAGRAYEEQSISNDVLCAPAGCSKWGSRILAVSVRATTPRSLPSLDPTTHSVS